MEHFYTRHVLHSLSIARVIQFAPQTVVVDIGTGGGFPGVPLAVMFPQVEFHLVDSIRKKTTVITEVAQALGLQNVTVHNKRAEQVGVVYDFCVSRAVAPLEELLGWVKKDCSPNNFNTLANGFICLKGGDLSEEIKAATRRYKLPPPQQWQLQDFFPDPWFETKKLLHLPL